MSKKKGKKSIKNVNLGQGALKSALVRVFRHSPKVRFHAKQIIKKLQIRNTKSQVDAALADLAKKQIIRQLENGKFIFLRAEAKQESKSSQGVVDMIRSGAAYVAVEGLNKDIYIQQHSLNGALHGDVVVVGLKSREGRRPEGKVLKVLERSMSDFKAKIIKSKHSILAEVTHKAATFNLRLDNAKDFQDLPEGTPVIVHVSNWSLDTKIDHRGSITEVLSGKSDVEIEMLSVLLSEGFSGSYPKHLDDDAAKLPNEVTVNARDLAERVDFRGHTTLTIDPADAKDFDDAISLKSEENGGYTLGIHIADVTHYVKLDTPLDDEAYDRSTSVYLVDRVIPMLPEKLSNNLCSLRPNVDRYSFSAWFELDDSFKIVSRNFGKTIIHSDHRFTYEEAQEVLDGKSDLFKDELLLLNKIAGKYRKARFANGALNFESDEIRFELDENKLPVGIIVKERGDSHLLIEELMLLANREVATFISKRDGQEIPFIYRTHDLPDEEKLRDVSRFAKEMGLDLPMDSPEQIAKSFQKLRKLAAEDPKFRILEPMGIRAMAKAEYTVDNIGHYGLAFDHYTHFTSPIRRYADVWVHRILNKNLEGSHRVKKAFLVEQAKHISRQERRAQKAERESTKYYQLLYMKQFEGQEMEGLVSGMIEMGMFVQIKKTKAEGMVTFGSLSEPYKLAESSLQAVGSKSGHEIHMGDSCRVIIKDVNIQDKRMELELVEWIKEEAS